jgi:hypothetical protein
MLRETELRYRSVPVELGKFEVPTFVQAQDIEDGVEEVRVETPSGRILNTYRRWPNPLVKLHKRSGLPNASFLAGKAYGELYRRAWGSESPPHSDPTRIIVDGGKRNFEPKTGYQPAISELKHLETTLFGVDTSDLLDAVCGLEMSIRKYALLARRDRAACKERLFAALGKYAEYRKRRS